MDSLASARVLPFSALVGQAELKRALLMLGVNPRLGGLLVRGERGTAKSTAARALARLLPPVRVVAGCRFGCPADQERAWCAECRDRADRGADERPPPFETLPLGTTEDQLLGTLDLEHALRHGEQRFAPGLLARVNQGVLYVDEVNLLDDHLVDLLLDVAALGVNVVAREGVRASHPAQFLLVGTMNPEEGELRPQLLDRFGLCAEVRTLRDPEERAELVGRRLAFDADPDGFRAAWHDEEKALTARIVAARLLLGDVVPARRWCLAAAQLCLAVDVEGHRADVLLVQGAATLAALAGRAEIEPDDLAEAAPLVLPHRLRRGAFEDPEWSPDELRERALEAGRAAAGPAKKKSPERPAGPITSRGEDAPCGTRERRAGGSEMGSAQHRTDDVAGTGERAGLLGEGLWGAGARDDDFGNESDAEPTATSPAERLAARTSGGGRRAQGRAVRAPRGKAIRAVSDPAARRDLAWDAILRGTAPRQHRGPGSGPRSRGAPAQTRPGSPPFPPLRTGRAAARFDAQRVPGGQPVLAFRLGARDLMRRQRVRRPSRLVLFLLDLSGSMGGRLTALARSAAEGVLRDAHLRRDRVCLVAFRGRIAVPLTPFARRPGQLRRALGGLPLGGTTPLGRGLDLAQTTLCRARRRDPSLHPALVLISDGRANVCARPGHEAVLAEVAAAARRLSRVRDIQIVFVDTTEAGKDDRPARRLATQLGAERLELWRLQKRGVDPAAHLVALLGGKTNGANRTGGNQ